MDEDWIENTRMIIESAGAVVPADGSLDRVRATRFNTDGFDRQVMRTIADLGWLLIWVKEEHGGLDLGLRETCGLMQVLGRGLLPEPVLSSMMAGALLQSNLPEQAMTGDAVIVTAWQDQTGSLAWQGGSAKSGLSGRKLHVVGAAGADCFAVTCANGVAVVPLGSAGLTVTSQAMMDGGQRGTLSFDNIDTEFFAVPDVRAIMQNATLAHSAYLLGVSDRALEITLEYLRIREQFGKAIGSFQSLQHRATEMKIQLELCRAGIFATARRFDEGAPDAVRLQGAARCKLRAANLSMLVAREAVQMHGAMGITDEADIGLFVRKAMTEANLFGSARQQSKILADHLERSAP